MWSSADTGGSGAFAARCFFSIGFSDGTTSNAKAYMMDNLVTNTKVGEYSDNAIFLKISSTAVIQAKATHSGFTADGATITWSTNDSTTFPITVLFLGGDDINDVLVGNFGINTSSGTQTVSTSISDTPKVAFFIPHGVTALGSGISTGGAFGFGAATGSSAQFSMTVNSPSGHTTDQANSEFYNNNAITRISPTATSVTLVYQAALTAFTATGFTLSVGTGGPSAQLVSYLLVAGDTTCNFTVKNQNSIATTGNQALTGAGFQPSAVMFGFQQIPANVAEPHGQQTVNLGAGSASAEQGTQTMCQLEGSSATNAVYCNTTKCIASITAATTATSSSVANQASLSSLDADGATINWDKNDGSAEAMGIIFMGTAGAGGGGGGGGFTGSGIIPGGVITKGSDFG